MAIEMEEEDIVFSVGGEGTTEILRLCADGAVKVKGQAVASDAECYYALKIWLIAQNYIPQPE